MIHLRLKAARAAASLGLGIALGFMPSVRGQDSPPPNAPALQEKAAGDQVVARLRGTAATKPELLGATVRGGEVVGGVLKLSGTVDRKEQTTALEAEASQLLGMEPAWKALIPGGASAGDMVVWPIRSELLPHLRRDLAASPGTPGGGPGLLRQTRIDDLTFDPAGRLKVSGLCVNQPAYIASQKAASDPTQNPRTKIAQWVRDRLKTYPLPAGVDAVVVSRVQTDAIELKEDPARLFQALAVGVSGLDDVLFESARFDASGGLVFVGLLGSESQRAAAGELVGRPEVTSAYARPGGAPVADPTAAVAGLEALAWRPALLAGIQERFARPINKATDQNDLRYCRLEGARFVYRERGGLQLRFTGVALLPSDPVALPHVLTALRDESRRLFQPPRPVEYNVADDLIRVSNPRAAMQAKIAAEPTLDGVRLDDVTIGSKGEPRLEGIWVGEGQAPVLDGALQPMLAAQTGNKLTAPLAHNLVAVPSDQILRDLRTKVAATFDETSLDRLSFLPARESQRSLTPTLKGAAPEERLKDVQTRLKEWLQADQRTAQLGGTTVSLDLTGRPGSLLAELRSMSSRELSLDGVRVDRVMFDDSNALTLTGRQDHDGQTAGLLAMVTPATAKAWPKLPPPASARVGEFAIVPLMPKLERVRRLLPYYREGDGVILTRIYYRRDGALTFGGRASGSGGEHADLEKLLPALLGTEPDLPVKLGLTAQPRDLGRAASILSQNIEALANNNILSVPIESLDEAIFLNPDDSTAWYVRAAYSHAVGDRDLVLRDLGRVRGLEVNSENRFHDRVQKLTRFQSPARGALDQLLASIPIAR